MELWPVLVAALAADPRSFNAQTVLISVVTCIPLIASASNAPLVNSARPGTFPSCQLPSCQPQLVRTEKGRYKSKGWEKTNHPIKG
jgi:hypothetical protein